MTTARLDNINFKQRKTTMAFKRTKVPTSGHCDSTPHLHPTKARSRRSYELTGLAALSTLG
jgi:hypothetical protein